MLQLQDLLFPRTQDLRSRCRDSASGLSRVLVSLAKGFYVSARFYSVFENGYVLSVDMAVVEGMKM